MRKHDCYKNAGYFLIIAFLYGLFNFSVAQAGNSCDSRCEPLAFIKKSYGFVINSKDINGLESDSDFQAIQASRNQNSKKHLQNKMDQIRSYFASDYKFSDQCDDIMKLIYEIRQYEEVVSGAVNIDSEYQYCFDSATQYANQEEKDGRWKRSYDIYRRLISIDPNNTNYFSHACDLSEKIDALNTIIEFNGLNQQPDSEKITIESANTLFDLLDCNYISLIDYKIIAERAFRRCGILESVLGVSEYDKFFYFKEKASIWNREIYSLFTYMNAENSWNHDQYLLFLKKALSINKQTINMPESLLLFLMINAGLNALDIHTTLLLPSQWNTINQQLTNNLAGIGVLLSKHDKKVIVEDIYPETPACLSELQPRDSIVEIDGKSIENMKIENIVNYITGPANTHVTITIESSENQKKEISFRRQEIFVPSITGWIRDSKLSWSYELDSDLHIGYMQIKCFTHTTYAEFEKIIRTLENNILNGLVIDLRSNPGGEVESAVSIADYYLEKGLILRGQPRCGAATYYMAHNKSDSRSYPIILLVNNNTASAAEILAGSLQDPKHHRAILIGERTYGKNTIQVITSVPKTNIKIKYSTATYHFSPGQEIVARSSRFSISPVACGLKPDKEIKLLPHEIQLLDDIYHKNIEFVWTNGALSDGDKLNYLDSILQSDIQLNIALIMLKKSISYHRQ